MITDVMK